MPLRQEAQEDDAAGPYIDRARLVREVEEGLWGHVALGTSSILDFHGFLERADLDDVWVVLHGLFARIAITINFDLRQAKVN